MKSNAWTKSQEDRRAFIGGPDARIITDDEEGGLLRLWREKRGETQHPVLRSSAARHACDAKATLSTGLTRNPVAAAYREFLAAVAAHPPGPMLVDADAIDLEQRADHLNAVFGGLHRYLGIILDDTAQNAPGGLDLTDAEAILADLASDLTGAILNAADEMAGRVE
jgi:hypothetical protein